MGGGEKKERKKKKEREKNVVGRYFGSCENIYIYILKNKIEKLEYGI